MSLAAICPKCDSTYSHLNPPKTLINCPHILCHNCLLTEILCPIDHKRIQRRKYTIQKFPIHEETLALCQGQSQQSEATNKIINVNNCETNNQQKQEKCDKVQEILKENEETVSQKPQQALEQKQQIDQQPTQNPAKSQEIIEYDNCLLHSKSAELVCMDDKCFICPSCALFGEHKHHKVQSFQSFVLSFGNLAEQCLNIKKELSERQRKLNKQRLRQETQFQMKQRCKIQVQNIKNYVNGIIKTIRQEEAKTIKHLQDLFKVKQNKIVSYIDGNDIYHKIKEYEGTVETLSKGLAQLLQLQHIQHYVDFVDQNNSKSYSAKEGEYLLMQVDTNYKAMRKHITDELGQIKVQMPQDKIEVIKNFITISSKDVQLLFAENKKAMKPLQAKKKVELGKGNKKDDIPQQKTPILTKNNDQEMLINSVDRSKQTNINNNSLSPIAPVGGFQYVIESHFSTQLGGRTERVGNLIEMTQVKLPGNNLNSRNTMGSTITKISLLNPTKREERRQNQSASLARSSTFSKNKSFNSSNQTEKQFLNILTDKNQSKKKKKIDLPQKYMKIYEQLQKDSLEVLDLGGAFLGDTLIFKISEIMPTRTKLKTVKFMNNKISDEVFPQLLIRCTNVNTLNLSYNNLTQRSLDFIEQEAHHLGHLVNITLSNNKIVLRSVKERLQALRKRGIKISL